MKNDLQLRQTITKLVTKTKRLEDELSRIKAELKGYKSREKTLFDALAARKCFPKFICSCYKDDYGCLADSLRLKPNQL
jgi:hypothetical protein